LNLRAAAAGVPTRYRIAVSCLLLAALLWQGLGWLLPRPLQQFQAQTSDIVWRAIAHGAEERRVIVIDIDEASLREIGPWPWPRATQAKLINQLAALGVRQQILDIVFADLAAGDPLLAKAISQHRPVLAQLFALGNDRPGAAELPPPANTFNQGALVGALDWQACPPLFENVTAYVANSPTLLEAAPPTGHITPRLQSDGIVRQQPAVLCYAGHAYPALAVSALMAASGESGLVLQRGTSGWGPAWQLASPNQLFNPIPLDEQGDIRIPWGLHPSSYISLSASDVLAGRVPAGLLQGVWALVGSSAFGLNDTIATPFASAASGLQVHAQLMTALVDSRVPYTPQVAGVLQTIFALSGVGLLLALRVRKAFPTHWLPVVALAWGAGLLLLHAVVLMRLHIYIDWLQPALYTVLTGLCLGAFDHARMRLDRDRLFTHLSSYLPAPVAAALALQPPSSAIKAATRQVSVLFADIRNFSAYCEARPPEEAAAVLHAFFSTATRVIEQHGGVIEAFQGDAIIAVWNAEPHAEPADTPHTAEHPRQALQAAIALHHATYGTLPDPAPAGLEPLSLGIGVETGPAMAGSFGLASRRAHMVMGRTVTIASRLVDMTADLAHPILLGEGLAAQVGGVGLQSMGTFLLEGMRVPHHVYAYPLFRAPKL